MRLIAAALVCLVIPLASATVQVRSCTVLSQRGASPAEIHAAEELRDHLARVTSATISLQRNAPAILKNSIVVGQGPLARKLFPNVKWDALGEEQTYIRSNGNALLVAGGRPRGTLYAVYRLLAKEAGVRWWTPWATTIPHKPNLKFGTMNWSESPAFEYRDTYWFHAFDGDWSARNFNNGFNIRTDAEHGGKIEYQGFVHTYFGLAPPEKYFQTHPEWYSLIDGKRTYANAQLCTTNPELRDHIVEEIEKQLRANPNARIASISQNDCFNPCQCSNCRALAAREGSDAALVLDLANYVAEKIEQEFPKVAIDTLAYQWSRHPTKTMRPRHNVIVRLCSIECNFAYPLQAPQNAAFGDDIRGWSKLTSRLYVWNYCTNFANYLQPHPDYFTIAPTIQFFSQFGVKGVFEEGAYQSTGADMAELKAWVTAQMLWDPKQDPDKLIDEFLAGYYGPASAPFIKKAIELMANEAKGVYLGFALGTGTPFLGREVLEKADALWNQALDKADGNPRHEFAIRQSHAALRYAKLANWRELRNETLRLGGQWPASRQAVADEWLQLLQGLPGRAPAGWSPVTFVNEGGLSPQKFVENLGHEPPMPVFAILPPRSKNPPPPPGLGQGIDLQDNLARLWQVPDNSELRGDPTASDGIACWMPGSHHEWAFQIPGDKLPASGRYHVFIVARADSDSPDASAAITAGSYDNVQRRNTSSITITVSEAANGYRAFDLGEVEISQNLTLWAAPTSNPKVKSVWIDRIYLVPAK